MLPGLQQLLDAINNGDCKFIKLSPLEVKRHREELWKKKDEGIVPMKIRKSCKDCRTKRLRTKGKKQAVEDSEDEGEEEHNKDEEERPRKWRGAKSAEVVQDD